MTKAIPRMIVLMTVVLPAIAQFAEEAHPRPVRWEHCCEGGYSRSKALDRAMATARARKSSTQMILVSSLESDLRVGEPHLNAEVAVTLLMATRQSERVALFFQTAAGTAIDFWDGPDSMFERRVLRGKNPFQVTPSIRIITYARRADDRWAVYCVTSNWSSTAEDDELRRLIRNLFPSGAIDIVVGDSPFYLEATSHLLLYPIHGWTPIPDLRAVRTRRLVLEPSRWARDQSSFSDAERGKTRNRKLTPR